MVGRSVSIVTAAINVLREFMLGVLVVPTALGLPWIGVFGGNAIHLEFNAAGGVGTAGIIELVRDAHYEAALYGTIDRLSDIGWLTWAMSAVDGKEYATLPSFRPPFPI